MLESDLCNNLPMS